MGNGWLVGLEINGNHFDQSPNADDSNCGKRVYADIHWYSPCFLLFIKVLQTFTKETVWVSYGWEGGWGGDFSPPRWGYIL
jgi:hypothetical protein